MLVPNGDADTIREAFRMRGDGETVQAIRDHLRDRGINRSYHGVSSILG